MPTLTELAAMLLKELAKPLSSCWMDWHTPNATGLIDRVAAAFGCAWHQITRLGLDAMDRLEAAGLVQRADRYVAYKITEAGQAVAS